MTEPPDVSLLAFPADGEGDHDPMVLNVESIRKVTPLDATFVPREIRADDLPG